MLEPYEKKIRLLPGVINAVNKLGPYEALRLFQDAATEDSLMKETDYYHLKEKSNAFWIITKSRITFIPSAWARSSTFRNCSIVP